MRIGFDNKNYKTRTFCGTRNVLKTVTLDIKKETSSIADDRLLNKTLKQLRLLSDEDTIDMASPKNDWEWRDISSNPYTMTFRFFSDKLKEKGKLSEIQIHPRYNNAGIITIIETTIEKGKNIVSKTKIGIVKENKETVEKLANLLLEKIDKCCFQHRWWNKPDMAELDSRMQLNSALSKNDEIPELPLPF